MTVSDNSSLAGETSSTAGIIPVSPAGTPWFYRYARIPFPVDILPGWLASYVTCLTGHFLLHVDAVAPLILAQLAGVLAENRNVRSQTGASVSLPFSVIVAARDTPTLSMALAESSKVLAELQQPLLDAAAGFDRKRAEALARRPRLMLPVDSLPTAGVEPKDMDKWRARLVRLTQQPLFWLEGPNAKDLRAGFSSSFDRTLLVTFSRGGWLEKLIAPKSDREANNLGDLLARLAQGSHLTVPGSAKNPGGPRLVQPRFGLAALTASSTLAQALKDERDNIRTFLAHSILLNLPQASNLAAPRPSAGRLQDAGVAWKHFATSLLDERRAAQPSGIAPHGCFHECLAGWQARLHGLGQQVPTSLHRHLAAFADLPAKLGSLLLAVGDFGVWRDEEAAQAALQITEWMLGRTLLCAATAQEDHRQRLMADAREKMLAKIMEFGPIEFWRLCRHFDVQTRALHEPTLHALLDEKRVRTDEKGKLVAA